MLQALTDLVCIPMYQNTNIYHCLLSSICTYTLFTYIPLYMYYVNVCIIVR